ncbi:TPA: hypothetical protein N0F65_008343 [Lagenidium giganteum]|uniref:AVL9/DENND6 domain-containing protein n=1 Tax=Lagenidium giganteum TaxID=4803 RepID=A0AAV2YRV4_9STRA|nr:TPA: hypothetical protein N0F65_008343 [Lagenidium giganteum]
MADAGKPIFAVAVVRAHRSSPGCVPAQSNEEAWLRDEVEFLQSTCATLTREDLLACGRLLIASLGTQTASSATTHEEFIIEDADDDEDEEEEVFNRDADVIGFREGDVNRGHSSDSIAAGKSGGAGRNGASSSDDMCTFFRLPMSHAKFLIIRGVACADPRFKRRYYVQQAVRFVVLLSNVPFQAYLKEKLRVIAENFFKQEENFASNETLLMFHATLCATNFEDLPYRELFVGLPVVSLVRRVGKDLLAVLRLLLLEGRVVCYSANPSIASAGTLALLALLPGVLATDAESSSRSIKVVLYRLRRYGMPFSLFNEDFVLQPCFVAQDHSAVYASKGFLVGTSDPLLLKNPQANLDVIVDLDTADVVAFPTLKMEHAFAFGAATAAFVDSLAERFGRNLDSSGAKKLFCDSNVGTHMELAHSDVDWVLRQFQNYFEHFLEVAFKELFGGKATTNGKFDASHPSILSLLEGLAIPVFGEHSTFHGEYGRGWTEAWQKSNNYENWIGAHRLERRRSTIISHAAPPQEGRASYTYPNGDEYEGAFLQGRRHGFGVYVEYVTKNQYEGDWVNDKRHGKGILSSKANGYIYDGDWKDDQRSGHGHSSLKNVENYTGSWERNRFHGIGVYTNAEGDIYDGEWWFGVKQGMGKLTVALPKRNDEFGGVKQYIGEWRSNRFHGTGTIHFIDGTEYVGEFVDGKRHGNGIMVSPNGDKYDGQWWKGFRHGEGSFYSAKSATTKEGTWRKDEFADGMWFILFQNGDKYSGECRRGRPWGEGVCKYANGSSYSGGWVDGLREGVGVCVNADGTILEGEWKNSLYVRENKKASQLYDVSLGGSSSKLNMLRRVQSPSTTLPPEGGFHTHVSSNGDIYEGNFQDHMRHGFGVFTERATGNVYEGEWQRNCRHGNGVLTSGMKDFIYDGHWEHDIRNGYGHCVIRGCETYSGNWTDNQFHGMGKYIDAEGSVYEGEFVRGKKHGVGKQTSTGKTESYSGEWKDGHRHGIGDATFTDGSHYTGSWKFDLPDGEGTMLMPDGEKYVGQWRNGMKEGAGVLQVASTRTTKDGMWVADEPVDGEWTIHFPDGSKFTGHCVKGRPHGRGVCKYANGDLYDGEWVNGKRHGIGSGFFANGESFVGEWENNHVSLHGNGKLILADGTVHVYAK